MERPVSTRGDRWRRRQSSAPNAIRCCRRVASRAQSCGALVAAVASVSRSFTSGERLLSASVAVAAPADASPPPATATAAAVAEAVPPRILRPVGSPRRARSTSRAAQTDPDQSCHRAAARARGNPARRNCPGAPVRRQPQPAPASPSPVPAPASPLPLRRAGQPATNPGAGQPATHVRVEPATRADLAGAPGLAAHRGRSMSRANASSARPIACLPAPTCRPPRSFHRANPCRIATPARTGATADIAARPAPEPSVSTSTPAETNEGQGSLGLPSEAATRVVVLGAGVAALGFTLPWADMSSAGA